jgi:hypothetical protein
VSLGIRDPEPAQTSESKKVQVFTGILPAERVTGQIFPNSIQEAVTISLVPEKSMLMRDTKTPVYLIFTIIL